MTPDKDLHSPHCKVHVSICCSSYHHLHTTNGCCKKIACDHRAGKKQCWIFHLEPLQVTDILVQKAFPSSYTEVSTPSLDARLKTP